MKIVNSESPFTLFVKKLHKGIWQSPKYILGISLSLTLDKKWIFPLRISSVSEQIRRKLRIWSHLLKKSLMEYFIFSAGSGYIRKRCILMTLEQTQRTHPATPFSGCLTAQFEKNVNKSSLLFHFCRPSATDK